MLSNEIEEPRGGVKGFSGDLTFGLIGYRLNRLWRSISFLAVLVVLVSSVFCALNKPELVSHFLILTVPCVFVLSVWCRNEQKALPLLPIFVIQQGLIYGVSLFNFDFEASHLSADTIAKSSLSSGLFFIAIIFGWSFGGRFVRRSRPSRWPVLRLDGAVYLGRAQKVALVFLFGSLLFQISMVSGLLYKFLPGDLWRLIPVFRALTDVATLLGALIGCLSIEFRFNSSAAWTFFGVLIATFLLGVSQLLLSSVMGGLVALGLGLVMKTYRVPWVFVLVSVVTLGFLNQGKMQMRERYWGEESRQVGIEIQEYPSFFFEWFRTSLEAFTFSDSTNATGRIDDSSEEGQSLLERVNSLQNLTFVVHAMEENEIPQMNGETYTIIPPLLVPRILWKNKPRAHEGQVLLNLYFGRQLTREQTEETYIAWGLLPEAIGNFGLFGGPLYLGGILGFFFRFLERFSVNKLLFSVEGFILLGILLKFMVSYEMVSSVLITSTFQFIVAIGMASLFLHIFTGRQEEAIVEPDCESGGV